MHKNSAHDRKGSILFHQHELIFHYVIWVFTITPVTLLSCGKKLIKTFIEKDENLVTLISWVNFVKPLWQNLSLKNCQTYSVHHFHEKIICQISY